MKLSNPSDDDDDEEIEVEIDDVQGSDEIPSSDPAESSGESVDEDLASVVEQLRDEIEAERRGQDGLRSRLSLLEEASDRREYAVAELQAGFEALAEEEGWTVEFEYDLRDP